MVQSLRWRYPCEKAQSRIFDTSECEGFRCSRHDVLGELWASQAMTATGSSRAVPADYEYRESREVRGREYRPGDRCASGVVVIRGNVARARLGIIRSLHRRVFVSSEQIPGDTKVRAWGHSSVSLPAFQSPRTTSMFLHRDVGSFFAIVADPL